MRNFQGFLLFDARSLGFIEMEKKLRLRAPNYQIYENMLLCDLVEKYKHVIENRKTDGVNLLQKQKAWRQVEKEFNAISGGYLRTLASLQQNYKNLKKRAKKNAYNAKIKIPVNNINLLDNIEECGTSSVGWKPISQNIGVPEVQCQSIFIKMNKEADIKEKRKKNVIMGKGGGPSPDDEDDPLLIKVKSLIGPSMDGSYTIYNGNRSLISTQNATPLEENNGKNILLNDKDYDKDSSEPEKDNASFTITTESQKPRQEQQYFTYDRANLKKKPNELLTRNRKEKVILQVPEMQTVSEKFESLATEKMELVEIQKELLKLQLFEEQENLEHNRLLRAMELEDAKSKYAHNTVIRKLELVNFNKMQ